jgi:hypothetical protein
MSRRPQPSSPPPDVLADVSALLLRTGWRQGDREMVQRGMKMQEKECPPKAPKR